MAITFRAVASASNLKVTTITITKPTGTVQNDVLVAILYFYADGPDPGTITPPAGWTQIRVDGTTARELAQYCAYKVAGAAEGANYTFTWIGMQADVSAAMGAFSGGDTTTPINIHGGQKNASSTSITAPSITTTVANTLLCCGMGIMGSVALTITPATGMTERSDTGNTGGRGGAWHETADQVIKMDIMLFCAELIGRRYKIIWQ